MDRTIYFVMKHYVPQLDYLKSVFIVLMILFHLVYIGDTYPYLKQVVYTFHMPIFLIISGYLSGVDKGVKTFFRGFWWLFFPYLVMEGGYVVAASVLPVREEVGGCDAANLLWRIFVDPVGPYWYLHTLLLCRAIYFVVNGLFRCKWGNGGILVAAGLCFWGASEGLGLMTFSCSMFFLLGAAIRRCNADFLSFFCPSVWSLVPLVILCCYPTNLSQFNLGGCAIVYLSASLALGIYPYLSQGAIRFGTFIGKNTLCILLFSPVFTMLSRVYQPVFMFEPTGVCFALFTLAVTIAGCLAITWCMDRLKLSSWFFGQERMLKR